MPTSVEAVQVFLGLTPARPVDLAALTAAVDAANAAAVGYLSVDPAGPWTADQDQGATILAARLYGRRGSVQGIAAFQDVGVSLLPRMDPDVQVLWKLGNYQDSVVS
jgi:hypothetical protein